MSEYDKRQYYKVKSDPVTYAAYLDRKRRERKAKPEYERQRKANWRAANAERNRIMRRAQHAVEHAITAGKLRRATECSKCGETGNIEAHHWSYEKEHWLHVIWLCIGCHAKEHN